MVRTAEAEKKKYVAEWVLKHRKRAGAGTGNFPGAECLYLTVGVNETVYGVLGISIEKKRLESFEKSILQAIIGECALALENEQITIEKKKRQFWQKMNSFAQTFCGRFHMICGHR